MWADQPIHDWIDSVCRHYSRVTSRSLTFEPDGQLSPVVRPTAGNANKELWRTIISDGLQTRGVLRLYGPATGSRDVEYLQAVETAELTARLIENVLGSQAAHEPPGGERIEPQPERISRPGKSGPATRIDSAWSLLATKPERLLETLRKLTHFPVAGLLTHTPEATAVPARVLLTSERLDLPRQVLTECDARFRRLEPEDALTVIRRSTSPDALRAILPQDASTAVVQRIGVTSTWKATLWMLDRRDRRLTQRDHHVLTCVSARLQQLFDQARLLDDSSRGRRLDAELRVASRTQSSAPVRYTGEQRWCELAACTHSGKEIGGDLFELIPLDDARLFIAVGDAAGHGIPAALVMAGVRGAIRMLVDRHPEVSPAHHPPDPEVVLRRVNSVLHDIAGADQFMSLFCGIVDGRTMTLAYANAGHPPPLFLRERRVQPLDAHGMILGVVDEMTYSRAEVTIRPGDVLTFFTDGVTEAISRTGSYFGTDDLTQRLIRSQKQSAVEMQKEIWSALQRHVSGSMRDEDRTLAVLRICRRYPSTNSGVPADDCAPASRATINSLLARSIQD